MQNRNSILLAVALLVIATLLVFRGELHAHDMLESLRSLKDGSKWEAPPHHKDRLIEVGYIKDVGGHHQLTKAAVDRVARGR
jgi:hypothetical protein